MSVPIIDLPDGNKIPQIGLGLWKVKDETEFRTAFKTALEAGYRHYDSAQVYGNEQFLGACWQESGLERDKLFMTTKIAITHFGPKHLNESFDDSLSKLQTDYVDLLLLHFPVTLMRQKAWLELEKLQAANRVKSIGVSNYTIHHLEEMKEYANVMPAVNQVELHVFLQQPELLDYCKEHNIVVEAYSPLAHAHEMDDPVIQQIAEKHGKTYAQIMLRWCVEKDLVVLPKSVTPERIKENFEIFDFQLDDEDMAAIAKLDKDMRTAWSPVHIP